MLSYPEAHDPADNASVRPYYGNPISFRVRRIKDEHGNFTDAIWVLFDTPKNVERYLATRDDTNLLTTETEALEQAGATFFAKRYQCEILRHVEGRPATLVTDMAFRKVKVTEENLRKAEEELDSNPGGFEEDYIAEERKTLAWVRERMLQEGDAAWLAE